MSFEQAREYLARVLPWPQQGDPTSFVNVHWTFKSEKYDKPGWGGRAVLTVDEAVKAVEFALKGKDTLDVYCCMSTQREAQETITPKKYKYWKPVRFQENAVGLKSFFLDIDADKVGENVKGYATLPLAVTALGNFIKATGLPKPSMMVSSGGGLHVYWTLMRALTPQEWYPLACALIEATKRHGLMLDEAVTTDAARILRVPNTWNCKKDPKRAVKIVGKPTDFDYTLERIAKVLEPYKVEATFLAGRAPTMQFEVAGVPARAPLQGVSDLSAGIETAMPLLELRACLDAIPNNRTDWNFWNTIGMRVYAASEGQQYGLDEWQRWSDTNPVAGAKESCADRWGVLHQSPPTRTGAGALVNEVRTITGDPNWQARGTAPVAAPTAQAAPAQGPLALVATNDLPRGYTRSPDGVVMLIGQNEDGTALFTPISDYPITDGWLQKDPRTLHFTTITERGRQQQIEILLECIGTMQMRGILQSQGFMLRINAKLAQEFFVAWIQKLQASRDSVSAAPFGWSINNGKWEGFVYAGTLYTPTGTKPAANADPMLAKQYTPTGELKKWSDAADLITLQQRPDTSAILASAFAAPLVKVLGEQGLLMSTYSQESGIGKSTALKVGQAVWGDPIRGVSGTTDTSNSVFRKMGEVNALPIYWDELKTDEDVKKFVDITFRLTGGREKSRLTSTIKQREAGVWQTLLLSASNDSLLDYIANHTSTTPAGIMRIFEFEIAKGTVHQIEPSDARLMIAELDHNYGQAGLIYAQFLGANFERIRKEVADYARELGREVKATQEERFWTAIMTAVCLGAKYANDLGLTDLDEVALKAFMIERLEGMRTERREQPVDMRKAINVSNMLAQFFNAMQGRHTIKTNRVHISSGKPAVGSIKIVSDTSRLDGVYVHIGMEDKLVRISSTYLSTWLKDKGMSRHIFTDALIKELGAKKINGRMASGTPHAGATEHLLQLDLAGHALVDFIDEA